MVDGGRPCINNNPTYAHTRGSQHSEHNAEQKPHIELNKSL